MVYKGALIAPFTPLGTLYRYMFCMFPLSMTSLYCYFVTDFEIKLQKMM